MGRYPKAKNVREIEIISYTFAVAIVAGAIGALIGIYSALKAESIEAHKVYIEQQVKR